MNKKINGNCAEKFVKNAVWRKRNLSAKIICKMNFENVAQK